MNFVPRRIFTSVLNLCLVSKNQQGCQWSRSWHLLGDHYATWYSPKAIISRRTPKRGDRGLDREGLRQQCRSLGRRRHWGDAEKRGWPALFSWEFDRLNGEKVSRGVTLWPLATAPLHLSRLSWTPPLDTSSPSSPLSSLSSLSWFDKRAGHPLFSAPPQHRLLPCFNIVVEAPHDQVLYHLFL